MSSNWYLRRFQASTLPVAVSASRWCNSYTNEEEQQPQHTASVCLCASVCVHRGCYSLKTWAQSTRRAVCHGKKANLSVEKCLEVRLLLCICHCVQCTAELLLQQLYHSSGYIYFILFFFLKSKNCNLDFFGHFWGNGQKKESNRCILMFWPLRF